MSLSRSIARTGRSVSLHTAETTAGSAESPPSSEVVDHEDPVGAAVVRPRDVARMQHDDLEEGGGRALRLDPCSQWTS